MNGIFIFSDEIQAELQELEFYCESLVRMLPLLHQKIKYLVEKIKACDNFDEAKEFFDLLDLMHSALAKVVFKYNIGLPGKLRNFVRDFDNLEAKKSQLFYDIKNGAQY